jgi:hypothetical protein
MNRLLCILSTLVAACDGGNNRDGNMLKSYRGVGRSMLTWREAWVQKRVATGYGVLRFSRALSPAFSVLYASLDHNKDITKRTLNSFCGHSIGETAFVITT